MFGHLVALGCNEKPFGVVFCHWLLFSRRFRPPMYVAEMILGAALRNELPAEPERSLHWWLQVAVCDVLVLAIIRPFLTVVLV